MDQSIKLRALKLEKDIARQLDAETTRGSGCGNDKGDIKDSLFRYEVKFSSIIDNDICKHTIHYVWLAKIVKEADKFGKIPIFCFGFASSRWYALVPVTLSEPDLLIETPWNITEPEIQLNIGRVIKWHDKGSALPNDTWTIYDSDMLINYIHENRKQFDQIPDASISSRKPGFRSPKKISTSTSFKKNSSLKQRGPGRSSTGHNSSYTDNGFPL